MARGVAGSKLPGKYIGPSLCERASRRHATRRSDHAPLCVGGRFWSFTMYEIDEGWWFVPNALNKFTVSPRNNFTYNEEGSLTLYFQNVSPGKDKEANWLPAPKGDFLLMLRMPKETSPSIINGAWKTPRVVKVN